MGSIKLDFSGVANSGKKSNQKIEPRSIFMSLSPKSDKFEYPRDVQTEVWNEWFKVRSNKNNIIKMNTGSGKTTVGLLILQSCLNETGGPAVYVVPDNYLIAQVCQEANQLGVCVTQDPNSMNFGRGREILIINIYDLVNGKSIYGMRTNNRNISFKNILIDDIHACLSTIQNQTSIKIDRRSVLYEMVFNVFKDDLNDYDRGRMIDLERGDQYAEILVPFWIWQKKNFKVYEMISNFNAEEDKNFALNDVVFKFPLIKDYFKTCSVIISSNNIEITTKSIPINKIRSFVQSERRIFMTATLADDSDLVTALDIDPTSVTSAITPVNANDIGDRMILFPQVMNRHISIDSIKLKLKEYSTKANVVVLVPGRYRIPYWSDVADMVLTTENITENISKLKGHVGLIVLCNKYDGVDLSNDMCRILVIDGSPQLARKIDLYQQNADPSNKLIISHTIQKIEQGMGRGVRSANDYCVVLLTGTDLSNLIYNQGGRECFSESTKMQLEFSDKICDQLHNPTVDQIFEVANVCLDRTEEWVSNSKAFISEAKYSKNIVFSPLALANRDAFNQLEACNWKEASRIIAEAASIIDERTTKGLFLQTQAEYINLYDQIEAQRIQTKAKQMNPLLLKPIANYSANKLTNAKLQAENLISTFKNKRYDLNGYGIAVLSILDSLAFASIPAYEFERAIMELSEHIGIPSSRPDAEEHNGPDNLWALGNGQYLVIECKNEVKAEKLSKDNCNQLNSSVVWFDNNYDNMKCLPIIICQTRTIENNANLTPQTRIVESESLDKLKQQIREFSETVIQSNLFCDMDKLAAAINHYHLNGSEIGIMYSKPFVVSR